MISEGYRTHRDVTGPMSFKNSGRFLSENRAIGILGPWLPLNTFIDLSNTALVFKCLLKTICMISEGYRTHRDVTGPMSFKKSGRFLSENRAPGILGPWLPLNTLIDLANNAPASKRSVKTICFFSGGYRTHRGVTGSMNFKKIRRFFFGKSCTRDFGVPVCHPSTFIDLSDTALVIKCLLKTICMISEGYRTHRGVTGPMNFKSRTFLFFWKIVLPGFWGTWLPSKHFI